MENASPRRQKREAAKEAIDYKMLSNASFAQTLRSNEIQQNTNTDWFAGKKARAIDQRNSNYRIQKQSESIDKLL